MPITVLFLLPYAERMAPSQRFRVEAYFDLLDRNGIRYKKNHFWTQASNHTLYANKKFWLKAFYLCRGFLVRSWQVVTGIYKVDFVFIHREASPLGPPIFEWLIAKVYRKKIIYDFDDAIWIPNTSSHNRIAAFAKAFWKVPYLCKWSYKVSAGNIYLGEWAAMYASKVIYNPTCVDMEKRYNALAQQKSSKVCIGWTGSHSTLKYLDLIKPVLEEMEKQYSFEFLVICDRRPQWELKSLRFIRWNEETEITDLLQMNVGIMPLQQDAWSEGKCGFKLIQYLALGIPAIASPVGVNQQIIEEGINGYLCRTEAQWKAALIQLMQDPYLRERMGKAGREKMLKEFSTQANENNFISLFS